MAEYRHSRSKAAKKPRNSASFSVLLCPACGRRALRTVSGDHEMLSGFVVRDLERLHCSSCGENLYSPAAMREIEFQRAKAGKKDTLRSEYGREDLGRGVRGKHLAAYGDALAALRGRGCGEKLGKRLLEERKSEIRVVPDQELWREAFDVLLANLSPSKAARVIARLGFGGGDYLLLKDKLFGAETVKSLSAKILKFQAAKKRARRLHRAPRRKTGTPRARKPMASGKSRA